VLLSGGVQYHCHIVGNGATNIIKTFAYIFANGIGDDYA